MFGHVRAGMLAVVLVSAGCGKKQESAKEQQGARRPRPRTIVVQDVDTQPPRATAQARPAGQGAGEQTGGEAMAEGLDQKVQELALGSPIEQKNYTLTLTGPAKLAKGAKGTYEVVLVPKSPYKVNKLYPHSLTFQQVPGSVTLSSRTLAKKDAAVFEPHKMVFRFEVTSKDGGPARIQGLLKFSVCTPKFCETPKAKVTLDLNSKAPGRGAGAAAPARAGARPAARPQAK